MSIPEELDEELIDLDDLKLILKKYLEDLMDGNHNDDSKQYIFETAMETFYSRSEIWNWINARI